jgi:hypothetical protein
MQCGRGQHVSFLGQQDLGRGSQQGFQSQQQPVKTTADANKAIIEETKPIFLFIMTSLFDLFF